jgi:hypothetical protein
LTRSLAVCSSAGKCSQAAVQLNPFCFIDQATLLM